MIGYLRIEPFANDMPGAANCDLAGCNLAAWRSAHAAKSVLETCDAPSLKALLATTGPQVNAEAVALACQMRYLAKLPSAATFLH
jgi:hypothetical protein